MALCTLTALCIACGQAPDSTPRELPPEQTVTAQAAGVTSPEEPTPSPEESALPLEKRGTPLDELSWPAEAPAAVKALFAGSWEPREPLGFDQTWFDEAAMLAIPETRRAGRRKWRGVTSHGDVMLMGAQIRDREGPAIAYAWWLLTWDEIVGPPAEDVPAVIHLRHRGRLKLWFDGQLLVDEQPTADGAWHTLRRAVTLTGTDDVFLVKCGRGGADLGPSPDFQLRVSSPESARIPGQIWQTVRVW